MKLETLLARTVAGHSTDLHLQAGERPRVRLRGELVALEDCPAPDADVLEHMLLEHVSDERRERLRAQGQLDFSLENVAEHQWRVHYFYEAGGLAAAFRPLPKVIPSLADLGLPVELERLVHVNSGLILLTGATGTGKTVSLQILAAATCPTPPFGKASAWVGADGATDAGIIYSLSAGMVLLSSRLSVVV